MKTRFWHKFISLALIAAMVFSNQAAYALPQGYTVESGTATFDTADPNTLNIHASNNAIINFNSFSIANNETVRFIQDQNTNSVLSRVTGNNASDIYGSLFSNGTLFLVNTNGINFHESANVQAQSLIASTLNLQSAMYLNGQYAFEKQIGSNPGRILNEGSIETNGGSIALLSENIENKGMLKANLGSIVLGIGERQVLSFDANGSINLVIDKGLTDSVNKSITNSGVIQADGGTILISAKAFNETMDTLINNAGMIKAERVVEKQGKIVFESNGIVKTDGWIRTTNLKINEGTRVRGGKAHYTVEGDWNNQGSFKGENSRVEITGSGASKILGDNTFNDLIINAPSKEIYFDTKNTQTILGDWTVSGAYGEHVKLLSMEDGVRWKVNPLGVIDISYAWVKDSVNLNGNKIVMIESTNRGNSIGWDPTGTWTNGNGTDIWSDPLNWSGLGGATPGAGDDVVFDATSDTNSSVDAGFAGTIGSLHLNAGYNSIVTLNRSLTTTVASGATGNVAINSGELDLGSQTFTVAGSFTDLSLVGAGTGTVDFNSAGSQTFNPGGSHFYNVIHSGAGTLTLSVNDLIVDNDFTLSAGTFDQGAQNLSIAGDMSLSNGTTFTKASGGQSLVFDGLSTLTDSNAVKQDLGIVSVADSHTLNLGAAAKMTSLAVGTSSTFFLAGNDFAFSSAAAVSNNGAIALNGSETLTNVNNLDVDSGTVEYTGAVGPITIKDFGVTDYYNLNINNFGQTSSLGAAIKIAGNFHDVNGTFDQSTRTMNVAGNFLIDAGSVFTKSSNSSALTFDGSGTLTDSSVVKQDLGAVSITNSSTRTLGDAAKTTSLTVASGSTFALSGNNFSFSAAAAVDNSGTFSLRGSETLTNVNNLDVDSGTVEYVGATGPVSIYDFSNGGIDYNNLIINNSGQTTSLGSNVFIAGSFTLSSGTFNQSVSTMGVTTGFSIANGAVFTKASNGAVLSFDGAETVTDSNAVKQDLGNVHTDSVVSLGSAVKMTSLSIDLGSFNLAGNDFAFSSAAAVSNSGTFKLRGSETLTNVTNLDIDSGTVQYNGAAGPVTIKDFGAVDYFNLQINNFGQVSSLGANLDVDGSFVLTAGTFDQSTRTMNVAGSFALSNGGIFTKSSNGSALTFDGTGLLTDSNAVKQDLGAVVISNNSTRTLGDAVNMTSLTIGAGSTFALAGNNFSFSSAAAVSNSGIISLQGSETFTNVNNLDIDSGSVNYVGDGDSAADTFTITDFGAVDYFNLNIASVDAADIYRITNPVSVAGVMTVSSGTFNANTRTAAVAGLTTLSGGTYQASTATQTFTSGLTISGGTFSGGAGDVSVPGNVIFSSGTLTAPSGSFTIGGNWTKSGAGTFTPGTNTVTFNSAGTQTLDSGGSSFYGITHSGTGTLQLITNNLTVTGDFTNSAGIFDLNTMNWTMTGATFSNLATVLLQGSETITGLTPDTDSGTFRYVGDGDSAADIFTISDFGGTDYFNLVIANTDASDVSRINAALVVAGSLTITGGTYNANTNTTAVTGLTTVSSGTYLASTALQTLTGGLTVSGGTFTGAAGNVSVPGNLTLSSGALTAPSGSFTVGGNWIRSGGTFTPGTNTVTFNSAAVRTLDSGGANFYNINHTGAGTLQLTGNDLTLTNNFTNSAGTFDANGFNTTYGGNFTNAGTFIAGTGTATFNSAVTQSLDSGGSSFFNVTHSGSGILQLSGSSLTVTGNFTNSAGTFDLNGLDWIMTGASFSNLATVQLRGSETITGLTQDIDSGVFRYVGDSDLAPDIFTIADFGATDYFNLVIANADAQDVSRITSGLVVAGAMTVSNGTFNANGNTAAVTGATTLSGGTYQASTATQTLTGGLAVSGGTFTGSSGAVNVPGNVTLSSGTLTAPSGTFTVGGNWARSGGTFTPGTNTVTFNSAGTQTLDSGAASFYNIDHTGAGTLQLTGNALTVTNNFTNSSGTFDLNGQNWTMTGASFSNLSTVQLRGSETITGLTPDIDSGTFRFIGDGDLAADTFTISDFGATDYFNLVIASADAADVYQFAAAKVIAGALTISNGTLNANANSGSVAGLTTLSGGAYQAGAATQTLTGGLTISGGTFTGSVGDVSVGGSVLLSSGILTAPSGLFSVGGDWTKTGGTFTPGTNTVTFDGAVGTQTLDSGGSSFYSVAHTGAGTLAVAAPLDINGSFSQSAGAFTAPAAMTVAMDFLVSAGTFDANGGRVTLDTSNTATVDAPAGGLDLFNFDITTPGKIVQFTGGDTFNVHGLWTAKSTAGFSNVFLQSSNPALSWLVNPFTYDISRVTVSNSVNLNGSYIDPPASINAGNNVFWFTPPPPPPPGSDIFGALNQNGHLTELGTALESEGTDLSEQVQEFIADNKNEGVWDDSISESSSSDIYVEEGAVYVVGIEGTEGMIYDGESMKVSKKGSEILKREIYISSEDGILALRGKTYETLKTFRLKNKPTALAASYDGRSVYAASGTKKGLFRIGTKNFDTKDIHGLKQEASFILLNKKGSIALVGNVKDDMVDVYDTVQKKPLNQIHTGSMPTQAVLSSDESTVYVVERLDGKVSEYDVKTGRQVASVKAGTSPFGIAISLDGKMLYVTDTLGDRVVVIDSAAMKKIRYIGVGRAPYAIQVNPKNSRRFYVANRESGTVSIVNAESDSEMASIAVGETPSDLAVLPENNKLYVTNELSSYMSVVDLKEHRTVQRIQVGMNPNKVIVSAPPKPGN